VATQPARAQGSAGQVILGDYADDPAVRRQQEGLLAKELEFLPAAQPTKIICVGLNYRDHAVEINMPLPDEPLLFLKPPSSLVGHGAAIVRPPEVSRLDYEGELGVIIGRTCRHVPESEALDAVDGLIVANDITARNFQTPGSQWTRAKGYDTFAAIGPGVVRTTDWAGRQIVTRLNGEIVQSSSTDNLIFGVPRLIATISQIMTLQCGDLIMTGTPSGVGPMQEGDVVDVTIDGIGTLRNHVVAALPSNTES
jgi:2-keto-4-pentenoate hydratase/2-oxohepta-3-ene-1,7-dioic acid hydratase in catechol pathway